MTVKADAWVLYRGDGSKNPGPTSLKRESFEFEDIKANEVLCKPLYGCWEGNMSHALQRKPVDICAVRNEEKVVIGNAGVVRILACGKDVKAVEPGQNAIIFCNGVEDRWGYPEKIMGYDAPGTMGVLATKMKCTERQVIPIPDNTQHTLAQWAAFSLRYITAWSNWELAHGVFRLLVHWDELAAPHVWGWGGGVTLGELDLARRHGCQTVMLSGNEIRLETIRKSNITAIDRRQFGKLSYDGKRYKTDPDYKKAYKEAEGKFLAKVDEVTRGAGVQIFIDYVGGPVFRPTLKALSREGIITTAGWKEGMVLTNIRAIECIDRHQHIHTHYARYQQGWKAVAYAEPNGWMPIIDDRIYTFDEIPDLVHAYENGGVNCFPCYSINPE
jgi:NADPH:quinone reductase-like Zn-dependent oxidoreductase